MAQVVKAAVAALAGVSVLAIESAKTELSGVRLQLERSVQESGASVLALKIVSEVSAPSQGYFLWFAARRPLEPLG